MGKFSLVRGHAMRVTRLDGCGNPVLGPDSVVTTEGFISVGLTANQLEGESINVTNAAGNQCVLDEPAPKFSNFGIEVTLCGVNPELIALMTGQPVAYNEDGVVDGFDVDDEIDVTQTGFALELWSGVPQEECEEGGSDSTYGYMLLPFIKGGVLGDFTIENAAVNFAVTGARTRKGSAWGAGPYDVVLDGDGLPSPLTDPVLSSTHLKMKVTTVAPPAVDDDDAGSLGTAGSGATAGTPGSMTPANSYAPLNLAELTAGAGGEHGVAVTASPNTAWTTGQRIVLRDGSFANWSGTAWEAGAA